MSEQDILDQRDVGTKNAIEAHLWAAIDLMAATLVKPDPEIWSHLMVYRPKNDDPPGDQKREQREGL